MDDFSTANVELCSFGLFISWKPSPTLLWFDTKIQTFTNSL